MATPGGPAGTARPWSARTARTAWAAVAVLLSAACGGEPAESAAAGVDTLAARYPVLSEEPVGEPGEAGEAAVDSVPPAVRRALPESVLETVEGEATFYADHFEGRTTASGLPFRQNQMVAAHRAYPFGTLLRVTNLRNDRSVRVRVVDRGPFGATARARNTILDLSRRAARDLGYIRQGRTPIRVEVLE